MCVRPSETAPSTSKAKAIIVLVVMIMTICSCSAKVKVSCDVSSKEEILQQCKESPQFGIAIPF